MGYQGVLLLKYKIDLSYVYNYLPRPVVLLCGSGVY